MVKEKPVFLAGVCITNGVGKFHVCGENQAKQKFIQLPMSVLSIPGWAGQFAFRNFKGVTKLEAAKSLMDQPDFASPVMQAVLAKVIAKKSPVVKAPKVPKAPVVKAAKPVTVKPVTPADVVSKRNASLEALKKVARKA